MAAAALRARGSQKRMQVIAGRCCCWVVSGAAWRWCCWSLLLLAAVWCSLPALVLVPLLLVPCSWVSAGAARGTSHAAAVRLGLTSAHRRLQEALALGSTLSLSAELPPVDHHAVLHPYEGNGDAHARHALSLFVPSSLSTCSSSALYEGEGGCDALMLWHALFP